ncbi:MAG: helix-turn-helix domain-containing protein [Acidimicrobiales bacterium]|nr:helix-turn-helix domain-containing protein [Acidimicrobiales bacterium]
MTTTTTDHDSDRAGPRSLLTIAEVADRLGVTVRHVRRLVHERRIPYVKWGRLLRFDPDEIEEWIAHHHVGAV